MSGTLVTLRLNGDLQQQGFQVLLEVGLEGDRPRAEWQAHLPPQPELAETLRQWQHSYRELGSAARIVPQEIIYGGSINRVENCRQWGQRLGDRFLQWLQSEPFRTLDLQLREELQRQDSIRILLRSQDALVRHLPWNLWDLVERFPQAELVLSAPTFEQSVGIRTSTQLRQKSVRILAILGHSSGIDVASDRALLANLPDADVTFLVEPLRHQLSDQLWDQPWDILFFAGHSKTSGETGRLYLNSQDSLTVEALSYGLKRAIAQGLQLAIFNSCDGLGLAKALEHLHLPQVIVMREPVPDRVAQVFLNAFLKAFAAGAPLHLAERQARERLQGLEDEFPYASWLPVLCQAPNASPLTWQSLLGYPTVSAPATPPFPLKTFLLVSVLITGVLLGGRSLGLLQSLELQVFDQLMRLRPVEPVDDRILVVTVDEADLQYQDSQGLQRQGSLSDQALVQLLNKLLPHQPSVIGLDIFHDFEFTPALSAVLTQKPPLIAVCEIGGTAESASSIAAPPGMAEAHLGFSDVPVDPYYVIRRQFLGMSSASNCPTSQSLSLQVAMRYLEQHKIPPLQRNSQGAVRIGQVTFPKLTPNAGGYQLPIDEAKGYQLLLNYRQAELQRLSLRSLLQGEWDEQLAELVSDRMILIGVDNAKDRHFTPYSQGNFAARMPGVLVQAHMVSQIVNAVLEERVVLRGVPLGVEIMVMGVSAMVGGLLGWRRDIASRSRWRSLALWGLSVGGAIAALYSLCFGLLRIGWWLPFASPTLALVIASGSMGIVKVLHHKAADSPSRGA